MHLCMWEHADGHKWSLACVWSSEAKPQQQLPKESESYRDQEENPLISAIHVRARAHTQLNISIPSSKITKKNPSYRTVAVDDNFSGFLCQYRGGFFPAENFSFTLHPFKNDTYWIQNTVAWHKRGKFFDHPRAVKRQNHFPSQIISTLETLTWNDWNRWAKSDV